MSDRTAANGLKLTAVALLAWLSFEGFVAAPYVPTKGDVPTIGYGSTHYEDGTRVRMTDPPISRDRATQLALGELDRTYATCVRKALGTTKVNQTEFNIAVDFAGQYGCAAYSNSSIVKATKAGDYPQACRNYLKYKYMTDARGGPGWEQTGPKRYRFDCSKPGNKVCRGVWTRQLSRYDQCTGAL